MRRRVEKRTQVVYRFVSFLGHFYFEFDTPLKQALLHISLHWTRRSFTYLSLYGLTKKSDNTLFGVDG